MRWRLSIIFLLTSVLLSAQQRISLYAVPQVITCDTTVLVPVKTDQFRGLLSMQGTITWDSTTLRFDSVASYGPTALGLQAANFGQSGNELFFSWNDPTLSSTTIPDSSTLFTLRFSVRSRRAVQSNIVIGGGQVPLEFIDSAYTSLNVSGGSAELDFRFSIPSYNPFTDTLRFCGDILNLDAGLGLSAYNWNTGDTSRFISLRASGFRKVQVVNAIGCTAKDSIFVSIVQASIKTTDSLIVCRNREVRMQTREGLNWQYHWSTGSSDTIINVRVTSDTLIRLQVTDGITVCRDSINFQVSKVDTTIRIMGPLTFCATRDSVLLEGGQGMSYQWFREGVSISGAISRLFKPDTTGTYRLRLINSLGCVDSSRTISVTIHPLPVVKMTTNRDTLLCEGSSRLFIVSGAKSYTWFRNNQVLPNITKDSLLVNLAGNYRVEGTSAAGCSSKLDTVFRLVGLPRTKAEFNVEGVCVDVPVKFENKSTPIAGGAMWRWNLGNGDTSRLLKTQTIFKDTGTYLISLIYTNSFCDNHADTSTQKVTIIRAPGIRLKNEVAVLGVAKQLFARDTATSWVWRPNTGLSLSTVYNPTAILQQTQEYLITSTLKNGCMVTDSLLVKIAAKSAIHVPKAFSPNGDGQNDRLFPILVGINELKYFRVYNRWGVLVYELRNMAAGIGWDGVFKGKPQPMESFMWIAEAVDAGGKSLKAAGNTLLIR